MKDKISQILWVAIPALAACAVLYFTCINPPVFLQVLMNLFGEVLIVAAALVFSFSIARDRLRKYIKGVVKEVKEE